MLTAWLLTTAANIGVVSPLTCPAPEAVSRELHRLLSADQLRVDHWILVDANPDSAPPQLWLWFFEGNGHLLGKQALERQGECGLQVVASAAVAAAWETEFQHPPEVVEMPSPPPRAPVAALPNRPAAAPIASPPSASASPSEPWFTELGVGLGGVFDTNANFAGSATLLANLHPPLPMALTLRLTLTTPRSTALPPGQVQWSLQSLGLGLLHRFDLGPRLWLEPSLQMTLSLLLAQGQNFSDDLSFTNLLPALTPGVRLGARSGRWSPWLALWLDADLTQQTLSVPGVPNSLQLPSLLFNAALGLSWEG